MSNSNKKAFVTLSLLIAVMLVLATMNPSGMATAGVLPRSPAATTNSVSVNPDQTVTFTLEAPEANEVILYFQHQTGPSPRADPIPMTRDDDGIWWVTIGPLPPARDLDRESGFLAVEIKRVGPVRRHAHDRRVVLRLRRHGLTEAPASRNQCHDQSSNNAPCPSRRT